MLYMHSPGLVRQHFKQDDDEFPLRTEQLDKETTSVLQALVSSLWLSVFCVRRASLDYPSPFKIL